MIVPLYIAPEFKLPTTPTLTVDVPVRDGEAALTDHDWARNHAACLFWAVQRGPKPGVATRGHGDAVPAPNDAQANASFEFVDVVTMLGIEATESVQTVTTQIPIITNTHAIASGDVIYLPAAPKPKPPPRNKPPQTWLTDLNRKSKAS